MNLYKDMYILDSNEKLLQFIGDGIGIEETIKINEGAKPLRGGIGNNIIGSIGGKTTITVICHDIGKKVKKELLNRKLFITFNIDKTYVKYSNALMSLYGEDDILFLADRREQINIKGDN